MSCTSRKIYAGQTTCGIQSASAIESSNAYNSKLVATTELANSVKLQVANGIQANSSVTTSTKGSSAASAGLIA